MKAYVVVETEYDENEIDVYFRVIKGFAEHEDAINFCKEMNEKMYCQSYDCHEIEIDEKERK